MAKVTQFEELLIWQLSRQVSKEVYKLTKEPPFRHDTRFVQQIRAAVGSVMDNIAEGFERDGNKEFIHFLYIAKGSCGEVRSQLYRALDAEFISQEKFDELFNMNMKLSASIAKFIVSLKSSAILGQKNKAPET